MKEEILKNRFGYDSWRPGQEQAIDAILAGRDLLAIMPTGAGKSLCYQIPALILPGMTIVISPLISLMKDQVNALRENGCPAAYLNSSLSAAEYLQTIDDINSGNVKLLYMAPERLQRPDFTLSQDDRVPLLVIDEAHCVSQWGHDFRTSYLEIAGFINSIKPRPVTAAFTATATPKVREDIERFLGLHTPLLINTGFDRPNLFFGVQKPVNKKYALLDIISRRIKSSGIVYCATRKATNEVYRLLLDQGIPAARYHAGLEDDERRKNQDDFIFDRKTIMVATNAFGMGIDKSNVNFVVHYNMPKNIESYYQEAGRAGRDGSPADCILLYSGQDVHINEFLISHSDEEIEPDPVIIAHNRELLRQMTFYATGNECLRHRLLSYFGEEAASYCGHCSVCLTEYEETDISLEARKIISCVYRLKERGRGFGKTMIIDILRGSHNEKIKRSGLDSLSVWGIMSESNARLIRIILDFLINEGFLRTEGDEYPVVTLGKAYEPILREERALSMKLPKDQKQKTPVKSAGKKLILETPAQIKTAENTIIEPISESINKNLYEKLKDLRKYLAMKEKVPAYIIFTDASLRDMCRKKPISLTQFSAINGVGAVKLEKYGEAFINIIKS